MMACANYSVGNILGFSLNGFACIAIVVFLTSTQPFFIKEVIGIREGEKIGGIIGTLGFVDELTAIVSAPLIGTLNDLISSSGKRFSGSKVIVLVSFPILSLSLFGYSQLATRVFPDLYIFRSLFAIGVTGCMSMVPVMLNELTNSDFHYSQILFWKRNRRAGISTRERTKNGKYAALIGASSGLGAIFSVSVLLTLPVRLSEHNPELPMKLNLKLSYLIVSAFAIFATAILQFTLYNSSKEAQSIEEEEEFQVSEEEEDIQEERTYISRLIKALDVSRDNKQIQTAYIGAFVARSTAVATSVFIPLLVFNYYEKNGLCKSSSSLSAHTPSKETCYDGYIFAAILNGIAQTCALISAPLWGYLIDSKLGGFKSLFLAALIGLFANVGICIAGWSSSIYNPKTVGSFLMVSLIGLSELGSVIASMSILSSLKSNPNIGGLSGLYSLSGGLGILIISTIGGTWSDSWIVAPFFILAVFNCVLALFTYSARNVYDYNQLSS